MRGSTPSGTDVDTNLDGSTTYTNDNGSVTVGSATSYPDTWPDDVPQYPGASLQYSGATNPDTGAAGAAVAFTSTDTATVILNFYKTQLEGNGWKIEQTTTMGAATVIAATKDERKVGIYVADAGTSRSVTVGIEIPE